MFLKDDVDWLKERYRGLSENNGEISGVIDFTATYNPDTDKFLLLNDDIEDRVGGDRLHVKYEIAIREKENTTFSNLPSLFVQGVEPIADRHFNQTIDRSACLCSPLEENEFLTPIFQFRRYVDELVIPFLYAQCFYSNKEYWPWPDLGHGSVGLLESYFKLNDASKAELCIAKLSKVADWAKVKLALTQKPEIKGHTPCIFCPNSDQIRRCHPDAWKGIRLLRDHIQKLKLSVA
jgi:hypothetical protein